MVFVWLLLPVFFVLLWACRVTIRRCCLCLVACVVTRLALGSLYLVVASYGLCVVVGLQGRWLALLSLLGCL